MKMGTMDIFKFLPAGKKQEKANCKECGFSGCMAFALKVAGEKAEINLCPYADEELKNKLSQNQKIQQKTVKIGENVVGGEIVMFRHEKKFINKTLFVVNVNCEKDLERLEKYRVERIGEVFEIDTIATLSSELKKIAQQKGFTVFENFDELIEVKDKKTVESVEELTKIRKKAILERDENFNKPVFVHLLEKDLNKLCSKASLLICKYANVIIFDTFDEALFTTLFTLRQNIFTDPEKPLMVESKVYEINNPDENSFVFLTTNFALSYFAVSNEISTLNFGTYLVTTPSEGMSVLTAWSAEKITAQIAAKIIQSSKVLEKNKKRIIVIPGLLADLEPELSEILKDWKIVVGTNEAYQLPEFVKSFAANFMVK